MLKPNLATDADLKYIRYPVIVQPKIDGVRGIYMPSLGLTGRSLKRFKNYRLTKKLSHQALEGFDGELCYTSNPTADDLCRKTTSVVNSIDGPDNAVWFLFDYINRDSLHLGYAERYNLLKSKFAKLVAESSTWDETLRIIPMGEAADEMALKKYLKTFLNDGYEGIIIRSFSGRHKSGRCTQREADFVRIKDFGTDEAEIVDVEEAEENLNTPILNELGFTARSSHRANKIGKGMLGTIWCYSKKWGRFKVSPGKLSHEDRIMMWENPELIIGRYCSFKYLKTGSLAVPRMATFQYFRAAEDML